MARQPNDDSTAAATERTGPTESGAPRRRARQRSKPAETGQANGAPSQPGPARLMLDVDFVRELIAAVDKSDIDTVEIKRAGTWIRISKTPTQAAVPIEVAAAPAAPAAARYVAPRVIAAPWWAVL